MTKLDVINNSVVDAIKKVINQRNYIVYPYNFGNAVSIESAKRCDNSSINMKITCTTDEAIVDISDAYTNRTWNSQVICKIIKAICQIERVTGVTLSCNLPEDVQTFCQDMALKETESEMKKVRYSFD